MNILDYNQLQDSNCTFAVPGLPEHFAYNFREIATSPREAELTLTWDKPASKFVDLYPIYMRLKQ